MGVLNTRHSLTGEGRETSFVTNCLSHYLLTEGLIRHGSFDANRPLVINMTSGGGYNVPLSTGMLNMVDPKTFNGTAAYGFHTEAGSDGCLIGTGARNTDRRALHFMSCTRVGPIRTV